MSLSRAIFAALFLSLAIAGVVQAKPEKVSVQDMKHMALKRCLQANYQRTNPDGARAMLDDRSFLVESYALDNAGIYDSLLAWVDKETRTFNQLTLSLKDESGRANNVLAQCVSFYESDRLDRFTRQQIMK